MPHTREDERHVTRVSKLDFDWPTRRALAFAIRPANSSMTKNVTVAPQKIKHVVLNLLTSVLISTSQVITTQMSAKA